MPSNTIAVGDLIYEYTIHFTKVIDYGISFDALASGKEPIPPSGARVDVEYRGECHGPKIKGAIEGVDYLYFRADRQVQVHIHAQITTEDGAKVAMFAEGVAFPVKGSHLIQLRENVTLNSAAPEYSWVNRLQIWAQGTTDPSTGEVKVKGYAA